MEALSILHSSKVLPEYPTYEIRQATKDINDLHDSMERKLKEIPDDDATAKPEISASALIDHYKLERSKRVLYAYHDERCNRLERYFWRHGNELSESFQTNASKQETDYFKNYINLIEEYSQNAVECNLDITTTMEPPRELLAKLRVIEDIGEVYLPDVGSVNLEKNSVHYLKKADVEQFIKAGKLIEMGS
ncbi:unnamed protein product [Moneuplotes crassus]|uniref:DNA replication complex GINS protein PSF1 n=1 Tax=Euplotes crassus TaxID=5936 RepID=A0AAD2D742_EUPCR|nr:unnamed protein product [Moneuplotes crassus]